MARSAPVKPSRPVKPPPPAWLAAALAAAVLLIIVYVFTRPAKQPASNANLRGAPVAATPLNFTDFVGRVSAIDKQIVTVDVMITEPSGQQHVRHYRVSVDDKTAMQLAGQGAPQMLTISDLHLKDIVQVYADHNLYPVQQFIATRLVKIQTS